MKKRCYTQYSYAIWFILAGVMLLFSFGPLLIWTDEAIASKITWCIIMLLFCVVFCISGIHHMQFFYFVEGCLVVKSAFGVINKLDINNSVAYIEVLPTYSSWAISVDEKWICIYDKSISNNIRHRFKSGCANKKGFPKVQIVYSTENKQIVEQFIKIDARNNFVDSIVS